MVALIAILILVMVIGGIFMTKYNSLIQLNKEVDRYWINIDLLLKQRSDEIEKLIPTLESFMHYEKSIIQKVLDARASYIPGVQSESNLKIASELSKNCSGLLALSEGYPELKSDKSFLHLSERISGLESQITIRREAYNEAVTNFNVRIEQLPDVFLANFLRYSSKQLFVVDEDDKIDPVINIKQPA